MRSIYCLLFILIIGFTTSAGAQSNTKTSVAFVPVTYNKVRDKSHIESIEKHISEILSSLSTVELVSGGFVWNNIQRQRESQMTVDFILSETVEQGRSIAAKKLIYAHIIETTEEQTDNGPKITVNMYMEVADIETAKVDGSRKFDFSGVSDATKADMISDATGKKKTGGILNAYGTFSGNAKLTSYMIGALENLDKEMVPFLKTHFGGEIIEEESSGGDGFSLPIWEKPDFLQGKDKDQKFDITERKSENTILIAGSKKDKIKKGSKFHLVKEVNVTKKDFNGNIISGTERKVLAEFKFSEYRGDFCLLEMDDKSDTSIDEILANRKPEEKMYIMFKQD